MTAQRTLTTARTKAVSHPTEAASRRDAHVQDTRRALLDTARQLFAENGFAGTRTEEWSSGPD